VWWLRECGVVGKRRAGEGRDRSEGGGRQGRRGGGGINGGRRGGD